MDSLKGKLKNNNVIIILIDQYRNDMMLQSDLYNNLMRKSLSFVNMFTYAPYTIASLHALISGAYGFNNGVNAYYTSAKYKTEQYKPLQTYLRDLGYFTLADTFNTLFIPKTGFDKFSIYDEFTEDVLSRHKKIIDDLSNKKKYFAFLHFAGIHTHVVSEIIKQYDEYDPRFFGKIDENKERYTIYLKESEEYLSGILEYLECKQICDDNTLLIVLTDHGCSLGEKPGELAYGIYTYDYTLKVWAHFIHPLIPPATIEKLSRTIDIIPTILDLLTDRDIAECGFDGRSLLEINTEKMPRLAFAETGGLKGPNPSPYKPNVKCLRTERYKLIFNTTTKVKEFFDLEADPQETNNLTYKGLKIMNRMWNVLSSLL